MGEESAHEAVVHAEDERYAVEHPRYLYAEKEMWIPRARIH